MKLKTQLNLLATFITAIPLACILFVCANNYLRSQKHLMLTGYEEVRKMDSSNMTDEDYFLFNKFQAIDSPFGKKQIQKKLQLQSAE